MFGIVLHAATDPSFTLKDLNCVVALPDCTDGIFLSATRQLKRKKK